MSNTVTQTIRFRCGCCDVCVDCSSIPDELFVTLEGCLSVTKMLVATTGIASKTWIIEDTAIDIPNFHTFQMTLSCNPSETPGYLTFSGAINIFGQNPPGSPNGVPLHLNGSLGTWSQPCERPFEVNREVTLSHSAALPEDGAACPDVTNVFQMHITE